MMGRSAHCPRCRKRVEFASRHFPFCSERCRLIDLGKWIDEGYRVEAEKAETVEEGPPDGES